MKTRSQSKQIQTALMSLYGSIFESEYDFDFASECWRSNKKSTGNGCYKYMCQGVTKKGSIFNRSALMGEICCKMHLKSSNKSS